MNILFLLLALLTTRLNAVEQDISQKISFQIEASASEVEPFGLKLSQLQSDVIDKLKQSDINLTGGPNDPTLILRIKSIEAGAIATFIQLAFFEESQLLRNHNNMLALTWSQASLFTISKEVYSSEVTKAVMGMVTSFIEEYRKAFPFQIAPPTPPTQAPKS